MDRNLEKTLEKIKKFRVKQQYSKIRGLLDELPMAQRAIEEVAHETVGVSLNLDSWQDALKVIRHALMAHPLSALLGGSNREVFMRVQAEFPHFSRALRDMVAHLKTLDAVADWYELCEPADIRFLIKSWLRESDEISDPSQSALFKICGAVGMLISGNEEAAFRAWSQALSSDPRYLKRIMAYCQSRQEDPRDLVQRLKMIRLVAASGKRNETLTLLKALGSESESNALKVLNEMGEILPGHLKSKEVLALRFNLALRLGDPEIIESIIGHMDNLSEDDLFPFKKQALHQIVDKELRTQVLLGFVRLYIRQENWENAAPLLQMLYDEHPGDDVVALMERVLDRFPIISSLRFILGRHLLERGDIPKGMQHLGTIAQVSEYEEKIRDLLEGTLLKQYDSDVARLLIRLHPRFSVQAGLLACWMTIHDPRGFMASLSEWGDPHMREQTNPFWALALVRGNLALHRYEQAYPFLLQFLKRFPELSPEAVAASETLCNSLSRDYADLIRLIDSVSDRLEPKRAWAALRKHFISATRNASRSSQPIKTSPPTPLEVPQHPPHDVAPAMPQPVPPGSLPPEFQRFRGYLEAGNLRAAAEVAEKTVTAYPQSILYVLNQLERLSREQTREILWPLTMLRILISSAAFEKAVEVGRRVLANHHFHAEMPQVYQYMARAFEGMDNQVEALRFYCLSSRQVRFYHQNRDRLLEMVLPKHAQFIAEVVQLVHNNEDQEIWEDLLKIWFKARPEDLDKIIKAQEDFTEQLGSPRASLDLAFWYLQAGRLQEINDTLGKIDLQDPEILDYLTHIAHLAHLKYPEDPKPKFLLGKYYLVHQDITKAVDTFRNLATQIPEAAENIYLYLRAYLKKNAKDEEMVTLYGLLIRFALDHGSPVSAVRLLEELARLDQKGAASLVNGVYRVIMRKEERLEAMYELMRLLFTWKDFIRLLDVAEQGGFGDHMAAERLEWLQAVAQDEQLHDQAMLAIASVYFETFDFNRCRESLRLIEHGRYRRRALPLYEKLTVRFPEQLDIWREAGWAAFPQDAVRARRFFEQLFKHDHFEDRLEAYGVLVELGGEPDIDQLLALVDDPAVVYGELFKLHERIRRIEMDFWTSTEQSTSVRALEHLISTGRFDRFREDLAHNDELGSVERALLESRCMYAQGFLTQAAWHLMQQPVPVGIVQSMFAAAGLVPNAILLKNPGTRLPMYLRDAYLSTRGKPAMISATEVMLRNARRGVTTKPTEKRRI